MIHLFHVINKRLESVRLAVIFGAFIVAIPVFALLYWSSYGISFGSSQSTSDVTFLDSLYFSVVTISSLGYGDFRPLGLSRLYAAIEVLFGLAVMGIAVAKLTSRRLSHHVRRLYGTDIQRRLEVFSDALDALTLQFQQIQIPQPTPRVGRKTRTPKSVVVDTKQVDTVFTLIIAGFHRQSVAIKEYYAHEMDYGDFFLDAPTYSIQLSVQSQKRFLKALFTLLVAQKSSPLPDFLREIENSRSLRSSLQANIQLCNLVARDRNAQNIPALTALFLSLREDSEEIRQTFLNVPIRESNLPDQRLTYSDQPQIVNVK